MTRRHISALVVLFNVLLLGAFGWAIYYAATQPDPHAGQHCVRSHDETYLMPIQHYVGKGIYFTTYLPETDSVCDEWVPNATETP